MSINFPNNPTSNQLYSYDSKTWEWNGVYWEVYSAQTGYLTYAITGGTYFSGTGVLDLYDSSGGTISLSGFVTGATPSSGSSGISGLVGTSGISGLVGTSGISGLVGTSGISGLIGTSGISGLIGTSGISGLIGTSGSSGVSGIVGEAGITGGLNLFFNSSVAQTPSPYRQLGKLTTSGPQTGITVNLTSLQQNVLVDSGWITDPGVPGVLVIPNGIWHAYSYFTKNAINDNITYYFVVSKYTTGGTKTLLFSSSTVEIGWANNNTTPVETKTNGVATTAILDPTDRIIVDLYVNNNQTGNKTVTFYTEGNNTYSYIVTTLEVVGQSGLSGISGIVGQSGLKGDSGLSGLIGQNGISSNLFLYLANTTGYTGNPGISYISWNNSVQSASTEININHITDDTLTDIDIFLALLQTGQTIIIQDRNVSENYQKWQITGTPIFNAGVSNYWTLPVSPITFSGVSQFTNNHEILFAIPTGSSGISGSIGISGISGLIGISGSIGISGISGLIGTSGISGIIGESGISGIIGESGISGIIGLSGISGLIGLSGISGIIGESGISGTIGISGLSGLSTTNIDTISFTVDTGGAATISSGLKSFVYLPYSGTILSWTVLSNTTGSTEIDIYKTDYSNYPPTSGDTIINSGYPSLSNNIKNQSSNLSGWTTTTFNQDEILGFYVVSAQTITRVQLILKIQK